MYERPQEARDQHRIIPADVVGVLLLDQRVNQYLESSRGFSNELSIVCG